MIVVFKSGEKLFAFPMRELLNVGNLSNAVVSGWASIRLLLEVHAVPIDDLINIKIIRGGMPNYSRWWNSNISDYIFGLFVFQETFF